MQAAIVIVSYNGTRWLERCLLSCQRFAVDVPVYLVDNASTDSSAELAASFGNVTVLKQEVNLGFAGGNNVGLRAAIKDGAEAVFLLNQDAELTAGCLSVLEDYLATHHKMAAVQPAIMLPDGRVNSLGNSFHFLGFGEAAGNGLSFSEAAERLPWLKNNTEPPYLSGAAVMLRVKALKQIGLFQGELFMYHEDLELSLRLRAAGWQLAVVPAAKAIHYYQASRSLKQYYYMERNRLIVWNEIFSIKTLLLLLPIFILSAIALMIMAASQGWFKEKVKSYSYFFLPSSWLKILAGRRKFHTLRQISDRQLLASAAARLEYQLVGALTAWLWNPLSFLSWKILYPLIRW